ncbi:MAG TPA: hypothetical protein VHV28_06860 [Solirubrobacteraceae bacterium]|nr:hypothetical protein [Solirubrobacteraceae bacterium]
MSSPASDQSISRALPSTIPRSHSSRFRPSAPYGAGPTPLAHRVTRSGSRVPQASEWGAPPEPPVTAQRAMPSASAIVATSAAACTVDRPFRRVQSP